MSCQNKFNAYTNNYSNFKFIDTIINAYALSITSVCIELSVIEKVYPLFIDMQRGYTPLHYASKNGHEKIVEQLLKAGANQSAVAYVGS